jgi:hypothetical protein
MTLKHIDFSESVVMRSLLKVAVEKGLVEEESSVEVAMRALAEEKAAEISAPTLTPTDNLLENVLNLAAGLRAKGFDKYADALEGHVITVKTAESHYDVSNETGDELIESTHPKGSVQMDDAGSEHGFVHTVTDRHAKILKIVEKKPTGKLSAAQAVNFIKVVLGESVDDAIKNLFDIFCDSIKNYIAPFGESDNPLQKLNPFYTENKYHNIVIGDTTVNDYLRHFEIIAARKGHMPIDSITGNILTIFEQNLDYTLNFFKLVDQKQRTSYSGFDDKVDLSTAAINRFTSIKNRLDHLKAVKEKKDPQNLDAANTAVTPGDLDNFFNETEKKLFSINSFISKDILSFDEIKNNEPAVKYLQGIKKFIDDSIATFKVVKSSAERYEKDTSVIKDGSLTVKKLEEMFAGTPFTKLLKFDTFDSFKSSFAEFPKLIVGNLKNLISQQTFAKPEFKERLLSSIPAV